MFLGLVFLYVLDNFIIIWKSVYSNPNLIKFNHKNFWKIF